MPTRFDLIVACDLNRGIGTKNRLPWRLPEDMKYFNTVTTGEHRDSGNATRLNAVIMGRKTWESIPQKFRPLADRLNIVVTSQDDLQLPDSVVRCKSLDEALQRAGERQAPATFIIGGSRLYEEAMNHPDCRRLYVTEVFGTFDCDVFFPLYKERFDLISEQPTRAENGIEYSFKVYGRPDGAR